jgi:hypothetical protein
MGSNVIATPTFVTGPNNNLATVDVFSGTASGIVNSIASLAAQYNVDLIGMLRAGSAAAQLLPVVEGIANGSLLLNPANAIARLLTASSTLTSVVGGSSVTSAFNSLSDGLQSAISAGGQVLGQVEATVGGVVSSIANGAISDIQGLGSLINNFAGTAEFMMVDNQALVSMAAGIINSAAKYGISGAFASMVKNITNPYVLNGIIQQTLPNLVATGDLTSLQAITGLTSAAGISAINPSFCSAFTTSYSRSASGNSSQALPTDDTATWDSVMDCYNAANPGWNIASRAGDSDGTSTIDLTSLQSGTDDFNSALAAGVFASAQTDPQVAATDTTTPFYALAPAYDQVDTDQQLKDMYPNTYIDPALRSTPVTVEPTQLQTASTSAVNAATSTTAVQATPSGLTAAQTQQVIAQGYETTAQSQQNLNAGYNDGMITFDGPAPNDPVGSQPNPATYQSSSDGTSSSQPTSNNAVNWSNTDPNDALFEGLVGVAQGN